LKRPPRVTSARYLATWKDVSTFPAHPKEGEHAAIGEVWLSAFTTGNGAKVLRAVLRTVERLYSLRENSDLQIQPRERRTVRTRGFDQRDESGLLLTESHKSHNSRSLHYATPDFLWNLVALANFMRLSLPKGAHVVMSSAAWQEIRVRSGRDDNFVAKWELSREIIDFKMNCHPDRSVARWRDLLLMLRFQWVQIGNLI
jgi:hypothetical protein